MRTTDKLRTNPPISALDFGVPAEYAERAESYARWAVAQEREACAQAVSECFIGDRARRAAERAIRARSRG